MRRTLISPLTCSVVLSLLFSCGKKDSSSTDGDPTTDTLTPPVSNGGGDGSGTDETASTVDPVKTVDPVETKLDKPVDSALCKMQVAHPSYGVSIGFPRAPERLKATGHVVATVIMVDFPDAVATKTPDEAYALISGAPATFTEMSYGRLDYELKPVKHWYRMSMASTNYVPSTHELHRAYIQEAINLADADVDFSTTDVIRFFSTCH